MPPAPSTRSTPHSKRSTPLSPSAAANEYRIFFEYTSPSGPATIVVRGGCGS